MSSPYCVELEAADALINGIAGLAVGVVGDGIEGVDEVELAFTVGGIPFDAVDEQFVAVVDVVHIGEAEERASPSSTASSRKSMSGWPTWKSPKVGCG